MENSVCNTQESDEKVQEIEILKSYIDQIHESGLFLSLSLHSLELSRRFNLSYHRFQSMKTPLLLQELWELTTHLEKRFRKELSLTV